MGSRLAGSLVAVAVVTALWLVMLAVAWLKFRRPRGRVAAAERFADRLGLGLPPEAADRLGRRLYRRAMVHILFAGIGFSAWTGWYFYITIMLPESQFKPGDQPPAQIYVIPVWAFTGLVYAAGHVYDLMRSSRETGSRVARIVDPPVSDAVPPILTWLIRMTGLFPAVAAGLWFFVPTEAQRGPHAVHPHPVLYVAAAAAGPLCVAAAEAAQRRILSGRQHAETPRELAFDDALRVQTMLAVMLVPWVVCSALASAIVLPLGRNDSWSGAFPVYTVVTAGVLALFGLPIAMGSKWARRYYLKRFAAYSASTPPPPPGAPKAAAC
jgi:hypothetical protein